MIEWETLKALPSGSKVNFGGVDYIFEKQYGDYCQFDDGKDGIRIYVEDILAFGKIIPQ